MIATEELLWEQLGDRATPEQVSWLEDAVASVLGEAESIRALFPAVGRRVGRRPARPGGRSRRRPRLDGGRRGPHAASARARRRGRLGARRAVPSRRHGRAARHPARASVPADRGRRRPARRRRGADERARADRCRARPVRVLAPRRRRGCAGGAQVRLRGHPAGRLEGLDARVTPHVSRMLAAFVHERVAAGRTVPADVWPVIDRFPPEDELAEIVAELDHPVAERREAARAALALRSEQRSQ